MKTKEIIKKLNKANSWRRGGKGEMLDPKEFGQAIDYAIESRNFIKEKCKKYFNTKSNRELKTKSSTRYKYILGFKVWNG